MEVVRRPKEHKDNIIHSQFSHDRRPNPPTDFAHTYEVSVPRECESRNHFLFHRFVFFLVYFAPEPGGYSLVSPMMILTVFVVEVFLCFSHFRYEADTLAVTSDNNSFDLNNEKSTHTHTFCTVSVKYLNGRLVMSLGDARVRDCALDGPSNTISNDWLC